MRLKRLVTSAATATALLGAFGGLASAAAGATITPAYATGGNGGIQYRTTVTLSGYTPNTTVFFQTCVKDGNQPGAFDPLYDCSQYGGINPSTDINGNLVVDFNTFYGPEPVDGQYDCTSATPCFLRLTPGDSASTTTDLFYQFDYSGTPPTSSTSSTSTVAPGNDVPEVPVNVLLPLGAAAVVGGAVVVSRRRATRA